MARRIVVSLLLPFLLCGTLVARALLDPKSAPDPLLDNITDALHAAQIDVVRGDTGQIALYRPRVARLKGTPTARHHATRRPCMRRFLDGRLGVVAASDSPPPAPPTDTTR